MTAYSSPSFRRLYKPTNFLAYPRQFEQNLHAGHCVGEENVMNGLSKERLAALEKWTPAALAAAGWVKISRQVRKGLREIFYANPGLAPGVRVQFRTIRI